MMNGYYIEEQKDGRGEDAEMVLIKEVKKGVSTDKATGKIAGMFPLKSVSGKQLPCLKVIVSNGDDDHKFEVRWSNYYEQRGTNPGKFKLVFVKKEQPIILYQHDTNNRKVIDRRTGKPMIDYVEMAVKYGSEPIWSDAKYPKVIGWNYGERQAYESQTEEMWEEESLDGAEASLTKRFGESLAADIMCLFVDHALFHSFYSEAVAA